jgi:hypothetical protein
MTDPALHQKLWFYLTSRTETDEVQFTFAVLTIAVLLTAVAWRSWVLQRRRATDPASSQSWLRWGDRTVSALLLVVALCSATQYFYGSRNGSSWIHRWDMYHQVIGSKYFQELGYFRLYECTWEIDAENSGHFKKVPEMRVIETVKIRPTAEVIGERDCAGLFSDARREQFAADIDAFYELGGKSQWNKLFTDKGFNGTPFHGWVLSRLVDDVEINEDELNWLGLLDVFLLVIAFGFVIWAWDVKTAAIVILFFCANFPNRYIHMGGSILRFDYIAMLIIALALLKKDRFGLAGICVAWATAERMFPAVFAAGLGLKAGVELIATRKLERRYLMFGIGFAGTLVVLFGLSLSLAGSFSDGVASWHEWWLNIVEHTRHTRAFRSGFRHMFMMDGNVTDKHRFATWAKKTEVFESREHFYWVAMVMLFAPLILAVRKLDDVSFTAIFAAAAFLTLTIATRYYYSMMVLFLLVDRKLFEDRKQLVLAALLMLAAAWLTKLSMVTDNVAFHYNTATSAAFSGYFVILGALLWIDPWLRDRGLRDRTQSSAIGLPSTPSGTGTPTSSAIVGATSTDQTT